MKKYYALTIIAVFALLSCENEENSSVIEPIESTLDTELVVGQETTIDEEVEIEELEAIQNQFLNEVADLNIEGIGDLDLEIIDIRNGDISDNRAISKGKYKHRPRLTSLCIIKDADRCPFEDEQPTSNMWWPEVETDYFNPTTYFSSSKRCRMIFATFSNGTALIRGITNMNGGNCKVYVNVWLKDRQDYEEFSANGGEFKRESGCASQAADPSEISYYVIDSRYSWLYSWGNDCIGQGCFGLEQRGENLAGQLGPNGAGFDSNIGANGFNDWGWITNKKTGEHLWVMDFNFLLRCCPRYH